MESREHAVALVKYFERLARETENREVWLKGFNTAQEWLRLIDSRDVSQLEIAKFMGVIHANRYRTSGWHDLASGAYHWAKTKGYQLPLPEEYFSSDNLPIKDQAHKVSFQEHANLLMGYFQDYIAEDPESPVWSTGLKTVREWQKLLEFPSITESDVSVLIELLENQKKYSSEIWLDLAWGVYEWFKSCGFTQLIPSDFRSLVGL